MSGLGSRRGSIDLIIEFERKADTIVVEFRLTSQNLIYAQGMLAGSPETMSDSIAAIVKGGVKKALTT